jgi:hypothetical protein
VGHNNHSSIPDVNGKPKTVKDLIRDISGATFNDISTPQTEVKNTRANSTVGNHTKNRETQVSLGTVGSVSTAKRGASLRPSIKSVNEVFNSKQNKAKFCMPLTL